MRQIIFVLGLGIFIASIFLMRPLFEKERNASFEIMQNKDKIKKIQLKNNELLGIEDADLLKSAQYYAMFMSRINHDANTMSFKAQLEIIENNTLNNKLLGEDYPGINHIQFKLTFSELTDGMEKVRILKQLHVWQKDFPIQIATIECKTLQCQIIGGMYGL